jgi:hypothetical protein
MTISIITDEFVEKAHHAYSMECHEDQPNERSMRAALLAVIHDIVEQCAKVCDRYPDFPAKSLAEGIRSLAPK